VFDYLVIAGGLCPPKSYIRKILPYAQNLITVDRGIEALQGLKISPTLHIGDNDSTKETIIKKISPKARITLPQKKSVSDLEYTLQELPKNSLKLVIGAHRDHEGRPDHALVNLTLAQKYPQIFFADEDMWITSLVDKKTFAFSVPTGSVFSILDFKKRAVSIQGSHYDLKNKVFASPSMGLSNMTKKKWVKIRAHCSALIFVKASLFKSAIQIK